jgi:hypothetical protein
LWKISAIATTLRAAGCVFAEDEAQLLISAAWTYVPTEAIGLLPPEARMHEPRVALDGGEDGLDVQ